MLILLFISSILYVKEENSFTYVNKELNAITYIPKIEKKIKEEKKKDVVLQTFNGPITAYGPDCVGCTTGYTASGYYVRNTIYYQDKDYGKIRIVAADKSLPFGTIVKISNLDVFDSPIFAIVLDRGSAIGFNRKVYFDLLYNSEKETEFFGKRNATFEILRRGY